ncbi:MAG: radical SAM protein [Desulfotignum sp.]|nr:radical SAM protein [Desulfotignum sp.]
MLNIAGFYPLSTCLGPGSRAMLWLQGCRQKCPGCITPDMQSLEDKEWIDIKILAELIGNVRGIEGITVMGGEPMLQLTSLMMFFSLIKEKYDLGIMLYTGYYKKELLEKKEKDVNRLLSNVDILIDGPYIRELDFSQKWRGSENQNIWFLSERYDNWRWVKKSKIRDLDIKIDSNGNYLVMGIPDKNADHNVSHTI